MFTPVNNKNVTLTDETHSVTVPVTNPDCPLPQGTCSGNDATATIVDSARGWFADSPRLYVDAPAGILMAGSPNNITGMTETLHHNEITVLNPAFEGATYHTDNGTLSIRFNKNIEAVDASKLGITGAADTLHPPDNSAISNNTVHLVLSGDIRDKLAKVGSLEIDIGMGAVTGVDGYPNVAVAGKTVILFDKTKPAFQNATYHTGNGTVSIRFSESIVSVNGSKISITDGAYTINLPDNVAVYGHTAVYALDETGKDRFANARMMSLNIWQGAVTDRAGNHIDASLNNTVQIRDTTKPTISGAVYYIHNGTISMQFSEDMRAVNGSLINITAGEHAVSLDDATISIFGDTATITIKFEDRGKISKAERPSLTVRSGAAWDLHGNPTDAVLNMPLNMTYGIELGFTAASEANTASFGADDFVTTWQVTAANESITIPGTGIYTVNWGDGTTTTETDSATHTYSTAGSYNVTISGALTRINLGSDSTNAQKLTNIIQWGNASWTSMESAFGGTSNMVHTATDTPDLSGVTSTTSMFRGATNFNGNISGRDISGWDTSKVTDMSEMFWVATNFNGNISGWDTSRVTDMSGMFWFATNFNQTLSEWDVSSVTNMIYMFRGATNFNGNISGWDVSKVTDMQGMFRDATSFNQNLGPWYVTLNDNTLTTSNPTVGKITAQNSYLQGQSPVYALVSGTGDTDNSLFQISGSTLSIKQSPAKTEYSIRIGANGTGLFGENNAVVYRITVIDTTKPTFSSAVFKTGNGELIVTFNESLNTTTHDASKIHIRNSGTILGGVTLSNGIITANGTDSITFNLNNANTDTVNRMPMPQIDIDAGAVQDSSGNPISDISGQTITIRDTTTPTLSSASYANSTGILTITFSESLNMSTHDASKIHIRNATQSTGGVTLSNDIITINSTNSITFDLSANDTNTVNAMITPQLDIDAGAVQDSSGNPISDISDQTITINDTTKPTLSSASYATGTGTLTITFSEPLNITAHDASKIHIRNSGAISGGVTLSNGIITANGTYSITFGLSQTDTNTVNSMAAPQIDMDAGAVQDSSGNPISDISDQTITIHDTIKPTLSSASYATGTGTLTITFSEPLNITIHDTSKIHIRNTGQNSNGVTLSNGIITANGTDSITFGLSQTDTNTVNSMTTPQIDMDAGAVHDISGNAIAMSSDLPISVTYPPRPQSQFQPPSQPLQLPSFSLIPPSLPDPPVSKTVEFFVELKDGETLTGNATLGDLDMDIPISIFLIAPDGDPVSSGLQYVTIAPGDFVPNATLDLEISSDPIGDVPEIPSTQYMFFDVNMTGTDFSDPATFSENGLPRIKFTVPTDIDMPERFADGCPIMSVFLYEDGNWIRLGHPRMGENQIYVTNILNHSVSIVDIASNGVEKRIKVGTAPVGAAFNAQTDLLYVSNTNSSSITVVNVTDHTTATIPVGAPPSGDMVVDDINNTIYVAHASGSITVINGSSNEISGSIGVPGTSLNGMVFDFAGMRGYVGDSLSGAIHVINLTTNAITGEIDVGGGPATIDIDTDTDTIYSSVPSLGVVVAINSTNDTVMHTVPVGDSPLGLVFNPHGDRVYVGDALSDIVMVIDARTHTVIREIPIGYVPHDIDIIQSTNTLYVTSPESGDIIVIDGDTDVILGSIKADAGSYAIAVNPDVSNPVRVPLADITYEDGVVECSYTAGLPHLSKFAVGSIKAASTHTVGSAADTTPPAFDYTGDEHININGDAFHVEHFETGTGTQTFEVGDTITMTFIVTEQGGADDLAHFEFLTNLVGTTRDYDSSDTYLQYNATGVRVTDPNEYFSSASVDISDDGADTVYITVNMTFAKPMASSDIILHMWDEWENPLTVSIPDMIEIVE